MRSHCRMLQAESQQAAFSGPGHFRQQFHITDKILTSQAAEKLIRIFGRHQTQAAQGKPSGRFFQQADSSSLSGRIVVEQEHRTIAKTLQFFCLPGRESRPSQRHRIGKTCRMHSQRILIAFGKVSESFPADRLRSPVDAVQHPALVEQEAVGAVHIFRIIGGSRKVCVSPLLPTSAETRQFAFRIIDGENNTPAQVTIVIGNKSRRLSHPEVEPGARQFRMPRCTG